MSAQQAAAAAPAAPPPPRPPPDEESQPPLPTYQLHGDKREIVRAEEASDSNNRCQPTQILFTNDRIRVSDFRLQPSSKAAQFRHEYPTIRWQVAYDGIAEHKVEVGILSEGGGGNDNTVESTNNTLSGNVDDRTVYFVEPGTTWTIANISDTVEYRQIMFEIQRTDPRYTGEQIQDMFAKAKYSTNVGTDLVFENELCRCWDFYLDPDEPSREEDLAGTVHHHVLDYVFINIAPSRLLGLHPETLSLGNILFDSVSEDNQVTWNAIPENAATDIKFAHGGKNGYKDRPMREYLVELK